MSPKKSKKGILFIVIIILAIGIIAYINIRKGNESSVKIETIEAKDAEYFILLKDNKYGVINKNGQVLVNPEYDEIKIPNPTKDIFICIKDANSDVSKALDSKGNTLWNEYNSVDAISIKAITSLVPYEKSVLKYKQGSLYGLMNIDGSKITDAIYEDISNIDYKEGYLKVKKEGLYGAINIKGKQILPIEYDTILSDGYYDNDTKYSNAGFILRTKTDEGYRFGYAKADGKIILEPIYNEVNRITEISDTKNIYLITSLNGRYGLIKNKKNILENDYTEIGYEKNNKLLIVQKNDAQGVFDLTGKNIVPIDYDSIAIAGEYIDASKSDQVVIFDTKGNNIDTDILSKEKVSDKYSVVIDKDNNYNILDNNGQKLLNEKYSYIEYFNGDLFIATKNSNAGVINANGKVVIPLEYSTMKKIAGGKCLEATMVENNKISIVSSDGKISEGIENAISSVEDNFIRIISGTDVKYYTLEGKETSYRELFPNNELYAIKQNGKWGFKDKNNNVIVECKYDFVTEQNGGFVGVKADGKWGVLDSKGNTIKEPSYKLTWNDVSFLGEYYAINSNVGLAIYCGDERE